MLEFRHVTKTQGKFVLRDINFQLEQGYLLGIIGKNGAGKSTLMKCMLEENSNYQGTILFQGEDIRKNPRKFMEQTAYIADDNVFITGKTLKENVELLECFYPEFSMKQFQWDMEEMQVHTGKIVGKLSRGEFIRFQLAFARARNARLYLLDEATAGMDPVFRKEFYSIIREILATEATVVMTTHVQSDLNKNMDYIGCLEQGSMVYYRENFGDIYQ